MDEIFKTIIATAANLQAARDAISNAKDGDGNSQPWASQGPNCFKGKRTNVQGGPVGTHYLMSGQIPEDMAALFAPAVEESEDTPAVPAGPAAALAFDYSAETVEEVCDRLELYPVIED